MIKTIPLNKLVASQTNVRRSSSAQDDETEAAEPWPDGAGLAAGDDELEEIGEAA